jgi:beta-galactosidase
VAVNKVLLGRYWPRAGPQETLYLPGSLLLAAPHLNRITILEQDGLAACLPHCAVSLVSTPQIDGPTPVQ